MGASAAYWISKMSQGRTSVLVVERDRTYTKASTALSVGSVRHQFSIGANIELSQFGTDFLRNMHELSVDECVPEVNLVEGGYLFLASDDGVPVLKQNFQTQMAAGVDASFLSPEQLEERFPWMSLDGISAGVVGNSGEGWFDPYLLLAAFRKKAIEQGVTFADAHVVGMEQVEGGKVRSVYLTENGRGSTTKIECGEVMNAAGPWANEIAQMVGVEMPVRARKRTVFVFDCPIAEQVTNCPLVIDPTGLYFRREQLGPSGLFITGLPPNPDPDVHDGDLEPDHDMFEERMWEVLASRVPVFENLKVVSSWAGYYEYNTIDQNGIIGRHPEVSNLLLANGFSGHGIQQAPAVGRAIAELVLHGEYQTIDCTPFKFERFAEGEPLIEKNII
eukprot:TRINITY_DN60258_c0_g1_i2.p1 TRINITY_DN60258_c0_g1~~TRINITY_DN60258_c0_g1_i2.p1  ORF type:complete len:390 (-),score=98.68 TRINITY_DN60258_c0_g1_i2:425-1594(-)